MILDGGRFLLSVETQSFELCKPKLGHKFKLCNQNTEQNKYCANRLFCYIYF